MIKLPLRLMIQRYIAAFIHKYAHTLTFLHFANIIPFVFFCEFLSSTFRLATLFSIVVFLYFLVMFHAFFVRLPIFLRFLFIFSSYYHYYYYFYLLYMLTTLNTICTHSPTPLKWKELFILFEVIQTPFLFTALTSYCR